MKYIDFKKYYHEGLESRWGTFKKAAEILDISASTLYGKRAKNRKDSLIK
jgi:transcriptional regulator with PAS, ATPase and Fis domain